ncbi:hypothetical protein EBT25_14425 [bacterium]|nr:hypothetical protein [bacterium]
MLSEDLAPVVHRTNWDLMRVPMRRIEDHFILYVADGYHRRYDKDTLPDEIKTKLAMILASAHTVLPDHKLQKLDLYSNTQSLELDDIGWRASESYYCLVLTRPTLMKMRGETYGTDA